MGTIIKLCGLRTRSDVEAVDILKPDYAGFILTERFWRYAGCDLAKYATERLKGTQTVGVVVDEPVEYCAKLLNDGCVDIIQLHGKEDDAYIKVLRELAPGAKIHKAFKIETKEDLKKAEQSLADEILLDSGTGCGETFDWSLLSDINRRFFLAGGLNPSNVSAAIKQMHPWAVDVSSGIETEKVKDFEKMKAFVEEVHRADI